METDLKTKKEIFWKNHVDSYQKSGMGRNEYCAANNISYHALNYWIVAFNKKSAEANESKTFVPVSVGKPGATKIEIKLSSGTVIYCDPKSTDPSWLGTLIAKTKSL